MKVYLIRHSTTEGNKEKRYIGSTDEPLCRDGIEILKKRAGQYPKAEHVYISPMKRCRQTAEIIYPKEMSDGRFTVHDKLRECDFGMFENHNYLELSDCQEYQAWIDSGGKLAFPGGESRKGFIRRTLEGFEEICLDAQKNGWEKIAVVAHGGTIMSIMERYARKKDGGLAGSYYDFQVKNGEGYELRITESDLYDGGGSYRVLFGSSVRGSEMAVSSGAPDRSYDIGDGTNYQKLFAKK